MALYEQSYPFDTPPPYENYSISTSRKQTQNAGSSNISAYHIDGIFNGTPEPNNVESPKNRRWIRLFSPAGFPQPQHNSDRSDESRRSSRPLINRAAAAFRTKLSSSIFTSHSTSHNTQSIELDNMDNSDQTERGSPVSRLLRALHLLRDRVSQWQTRKRKPSAAVVQLRNDLATHLSPAKVNTVEASSPISNGSPVLNSQDTVRNESDFSTAAISRPGSVQVSTPLRCHTASSSVFREGARGFATPSSPSERHTPYLSYDVPRRSHRNAECYGNPDEMKTVDSRPDAGLNRKSIGSILSQRTLEYDELYGCLHLNAAERDDIPEDSVHTTPTSSQPSLWNASTPPPPQRILSRGRPIPREIRWKRTPPRGTPSSGGSYLPYSEEISSVSTPSPLERPKRISRFSRNRQRLDILLNNQRENVSEQAHLEEAIRRVDEFRESNPSPLRVSFHSFKATEKESKELRTQLDDVRMEGRRIGVAIARARMIEEDQHHGNGEGLWVNRVFTRKLRMMEPPTQESGYTIGTE